MASQFINARRLIELRQRAELSQAELAKLIACAKRTIERAEDGDKLRPTLITKLASVFQVIPEELMVERDEKVSLRGRFSNYLARLREEFGPLRFLGLPLYDEREYPSLHELFVPPRLSTNSATIDDVVQGRDGLLEADVVLERPGAKVILGDPGAGKSTLLNYVVLQMAQEHPTRLSRALGDRIPLPFILRELNITPRITSDELLARFHERLATRDLGLSDLHTLLSEGRALLLLDGLDEIGSESRQNLRSIVWRMMDQYPDCEWLFTSRLIGYDELAFDRETAFTSSPAEILDRVGRSLAKDRSEVTLLNDKLGHVNLVYSRATRYYLVPFNDQQIQAFGRNWYRFRDGSQRQADESAHKFWTAVSGNANTLTLARIPNILTIMANLHRRLQVLPEGRAILYSKLTDAYLENIDLARGLSRPLRCTLADQKLWLGKIAWELQQRRVEQEQGKKQGYSPDSLLATHAECVAWVNEELHNRPGEPLPADEVSLFLAHAQARAGMLIERGAGRYAFTHLSLLEYFAAYYLTQNFAVWLLSADSRIKSIDTWPTNVLWHEVLIFAFEELREQAVKLWPRFRDTVFPKLASWLGAQIPPSLKQREKEATISARSNQLLLLARLAEDRTSGLATEAEAIATSCLAWQQWVSPLQEHTYFRKDDAFLPRWLQSASSPQSQTALMRRVIEATPLEAELLDFFGLRVSEPTLLTRFTKLDTLSLAHDTLQELVNLRKLPSLRLLIFVNATDEDLPGLAQLTQLQNLHFMGTSVTDLSPLTRLTQLQSLAVWDTLVTDISPLARLTQLQTLLLLGTSVTDLSPLAGLTQLQTLQLMGTSVTDISPLAGLTQLQNLNLKGTSVTDISPLAGRKNLNIIRQ